MDTQKLFYINAANEIKKWTGIDDDDLEETMNDLCGGLFTEIRKFTAIMCQEIEAAELSEDFKKRFKEEINKMWYNIESHQKIGVGKLCNIINRNKDVAFKKNI